MYVPNVFEKMVGQVTEIDEEPEYDSQVNMQTQQLGMFQDYLNRKQKQDAQLTDIQGLLGDIRTSLDKQNEEYQKQIDMLKEELKEYDDVPTETEMFHYKKLDQLSTIKGENVT